jgi:hypothetical protein
MIYYKYLDIKYKNLAEDIKKYLLENPHLIKKGEGNWRLATDYLLENFPQVKNLFEWDIEFAGIFVSHTRQGNVHIDTDQKPVRITFPIMNCNDTVTKYYKNTGKVSKIKQSNGVTAYELDTNNLEEVDYFVLNKAVAMRVLEPHQVCMNHDNYPRVSCTIQFKQNIEYLLEN